MGFQSGALADSRTSASRVCGRPITAKLASSLRSLALLLTALAYAEAAPPATTCTLFKL